MRLVKVITELRFVNRLHLLQQYEDLHRAILGEELKEPEKIFAPAMVLEAKQKKIRTVLEFSRFGADLEDVPNLGHCVQTISALVKKVDDVVRLPRMSRVGIRSFWIEPFDGDFATLLKRYKEKMLNKDALLEQAYDVSLVLDFGPDSRKLTVTTGPMELDQLKKQVLLYEADNLPGLFSYVDADYATKEESDYSAKFLADFVKQGLDRGSEYAQKLFDVISR